MTNQLITSFEDIRKKMPEIYKKVIESLFYVADLEIAGKRSLLEYVVALRKFLVVLEKGIEDCNLPTSLKFTVHALNARVILSGNPNLLDQSSISFFSKESLELLARIIHDFIRSLFKSGRNTFTIGVQQIITNAYQASGAEGAATNDEEIQQFSAQAFELLTKAVARALGSSAPSVPAFESDLFKDEIDKLVSAMSGLTNNVIRNEVHSLIKLMGVDLHDVFNSTLGLYSGLDGHYGKNCCQDSFCELFGCEKQFFDLVSSGEHRHSNACSPFFTPAFNPECVVRQRETNPEKDEPDVPEWEENSPKCNDSVDRPADYVYL